VRLQDLKDDLACQPEEWFPCPYRAGGEEHVCPRCAPFGRAGLVPSWSLSPTKVVARRVTDLYQDCHWCGGVGSTPWLNDSGKDEGLTLRCQFCEGTGAEVSPRFVGTPHLGNRALMRALSRHLLGEGT
jgi:hypothetical protein